MSYATAIFRYIQTNLRHEEGSKVHMLHNIRAKFSKVINAGEASRGKRYRNLGTLY